MSVGISPRRLRDPVDHPSETLACLFSEILHGLPVAKAVVLFVDVVLFVVLVVVVKRVVEDLLVNEVGCVVEAKVSEVEAVVGVEGVKREAMTLKGFN